MAVTSSVFTFDGINSQKLVIMKFDIKSAHELEVIKQRQIEEFADAAKRAEERGDIHNHMNPIGISDEVAPSHATKFQQQFGYRKYSMFKNQSSADDIPGTHNR